MKSRFMLNAAQVALVGAFGMLPSLALAQSDSGPPTTSSTRTSPSAFGLEDIIVTARKREESLQKVPIAVTAITTEQLRERQIKRERKSVDRGKKESVLIDQGGGGKIKKKKKT